MFKVQGPCSSCFEDDASFFSSSHFFASLTAVSQRSGDAWTWEQGERAPSLVLEYGTESSMFPLLFRERQAPDNPQVLSVVLLRMSFCLANSTTSSDGESKTRDFIIFTNLSHSSLTAIVSRCSQIIRIYIL